MQIYLPNRTFRNLYSLNHDAVNEYSQLGATTGLTNSAFTFGAWIKPASVTTRQTIIDNGGLANTTTRLAIETTSKLRFFLSNVRQLCVSTTSLTVNVWQHVMVSYNSSTGAAVIYLNGVSDGTATDAAALSYAGARFVLGANYNDVTVTYAEFFNGRIFHPFFYNAVLTGTEAAQVYNRGRNDLRFISSLAFRFVNGSADSPTWTDYVRGNNSTMVNMEAADINTDVP